MAIQQDPKDSRGLSRRAFLATGSASLFAGPLLSSVTAEPIAADRPAPSPPVLKPAPRVRLREIPPDLLRQVHSDMLYNRVELPAGKNALPLLATACKKFRYYHDYLSAPPCKLDWTAAASYQDECDQFEKGGPFPTGKSGTAIRDWLAGNQPVVELTNQAIGRGRLQFSEDYLLNWLEDLWAELDPLKGIHAVARFRTLRARLLFADGQIQPGLKELFLLLRLGKICAESDAFLIHRLHGHGIQRLVLELIQDLSRAGTLPDAVSAKLIQELSDFEPSVQSLKQVSRVEFCYYQLAVLERLPAAPLETLVDSYILDHMYNSPDVATLKHLGVTDDDIRGVRRELLTLLKGHPRPYDKLETARISSELAAQRIHELDRPYSQRRQDIAKSLSDEITAWPAHLSNDGAPHSALPEAKASPSLTDAQLNSARRAITKVNNSLGKKIAAESIESGIGTIHAIQAAHRSHFASTRIVLACRRMLDGKGKLPEQLKDLVDAGFLDRLPLDPFSEQPLRYSRERALLWSVGHDGKDDNADWDFEAQFPNGNDLVWKLPQAKAM